MESEYKTSDLYEAAYLVAKGLPLLSVERSPNSSRRFFMFAHSPQCKTAVMEFWNKEGLIGPQKYAEAINYLKDRLYAGI